MAKNYERVRRSRGEWIRTNPEFFPALFHVQIALPAFSTLFEPILGIFRKIRAVFELLELLESSRFELPRALHFFPEFSAHFL